MRFNFHCGVEPSGDVQHTMAAVCGLGGGVRDMVAFPKEL